MALNQPAEPDWDALLTEARQVATRTGFSNAVIERLAAALHGPTEVFEEVVGYPAIRGSILGVMTSGPWRERVLGHRDDLPPLIAERIHAMLATAPLNDCGLLSHQDWLSPHTCQMLLERAWTVWQEMLADPTVERGELFGNAGNIAVAHAARTTITPDTLQQMAVWVGDDRHEAAVAPTGDFRFGFYATSLRNVLATNPATPEPALRHLLAFSPTLRRAILFRNPAAPTDLILETLDDPTDWNAQSAAATHPRAPLDAAIDWLLLQPQSLAVLLTNALEQWRRVTPEHLDGTPVPASPDRETQFIQRIIDRNITARDAPWLLDLPEIVHTSEAITAFAQHPDPKIRRRLQKNPLATPTLIAQAMTDQDALVRRNAANAFHRTLDATDD